VERVTADGTRSTLKAGDFFGEDWLLSDSARAEMALDDGAAGRALRREAGSTYVASSSYQPVTLEITRVTLRTLWGVEFDEHLRSRHDVAAEGADRRRATKIARRTRVERFRTERAETLEPSRFGDGGAKRSDAGRFAADPTHAADPAHARGSVESEDFFA
jgi:hypothetical protein